MELLICKLTSICRHPNDKFPLATLSISRFILQFSHNIYLIAIVFACTSTPAMLIAAWLQLFLSRSLPDWNW